MLKAQGVRARRRATATAKATRKPSPRGASARSTSPSAYAECGLARAFATHGSSGGRSPRALVAPRQQSTNLRADCDFLTYVMIRNLCAVTEIQTGVRSGLHPLGETQNLCPLTVNQ